MQGTGTPNTSLQQSKILSFIQERSFRSVSLTVYILLPLNIFSPSSLVLELLIFSWAYASAKSKACFSAPTIETAPIECNQK